MKTLYQCFISAYQLFVMNIYGRMWNFQEWKSSTAAHGDHLLPLWAEENDDRCEETERDENVSETKMIS